MIPRKKRVSIIILIIISTIFLVDFLFKFNGQESTSLESEIPPKKSGHSSKSESEKEVQLEGSNTIKVAAGDLAGSRGDRISKSTEGVFGGGDTSKEKDGLVFDSKILEIAVKDEQKQFVEGTFTFRNITAETIEISEVKTSCGCLKVVDSPQKVLPGKASKINLSMNVSRIQGVHSNYTYLKTGSGKIYKLRFIVRIPEYLMIQPSSISWLVGQTTEKVTLKAIARKGYHIPIKKVVCTEPDIKVELTPIVEGKEYEIHITPPRNIYRTFVGSITVKTDFPRKQQFPLALGVTISCTNNGILNYFNSKE